MENNGYSIPTDLIIKAVEKFPEHALTDFYRPSLAESLFAERNEFYVRLPAGIRVTPAIQKALQNYLSWEHQLEVQSIQEKMQKELEGEFLTRKIQELELEKNRAILEKDSEATKKAKRFVEEASKEIQAQIKEWSDKRQVDEKTRDEKIKKLQVALDNIRDQQSLQKKKQELMVVYQAKIQQEFDSRLEHFKKGQLPDELQAGMREKEPERKAAIDQLLKEKVQEIVDNVIKTYNHPSIR
jgi:hypothetical protein